LGVFGLPVRFKPLSTGILAAAVFVLAVDAVYAAAPKDRGNAGDVAVLAPLRHAPEAGLPAVLSDTDAVLYRDVFALQRDGDWKAADRLAARLEDRVLMGHVLAQRYLHPTKYRSRYKELQAWLGEYADHPDARRLYKLALRRKPQTWRAPKRPQSWAVPGAARAASAGAGAAEPRKRLSRANRRKVAEIKRKIRGHLRNGWTLAAKKLLETREVKRLFPTVEYDRAKARLGAGYFLAGRDEWALKWAGSAAGRSGKYVPQAHWTSGLAAWRLERYDLAARHFETVVRHETAPWVISAAAFWAARTHLVNRRPDRVNRFLEIAAGYPRTFYGLLARRMLGLANEFRWATPALEAPALEKVLASPLGRRAMALLQVGENRRAEREMRNLATQADDGLAYGILALASRANLPALAVSLDARLFPTGGGYDGAAYPMPGWTPNGGFRVDRALIFALVRQESRFNPKAKSWAGARGLMQLMPRTAGYVARDRRYRWGATRRKLFEPAVNLALGQKYIRILLESGKIKGDLFLMATAWNGGPGNLNKWRRNTKHLDDPLFFIESIPSRETRNFIERVLTNFWIYRDRLGQPVPSLDAIAAGEWPVYRALDKDVVEMAESDERRK